MQKHFAHSRVLIVLWQVPGKWFSLSFMLFLVVTMITLLNTKAFLLKAYIRGFFHYQCFDRAIEGFNLRFL